MSTIPTTTAEAVREEMISSIRRIRPRYNPKSGDRWRWLGDDGRAKVTGRAMRQFQVILSGEREATEPAINAYSGGVTMRADCTIRVSYPLSREQMQRASGSDYRDVLLMLYHLHTRVDGMMPIRVFGRQQELMTNTVHTDKEHEYVVDFNVVAGVHFFASDELELAPEGT